MKFGIKYVIYTALLILFTTPTGAQEPNQILYEFKQEKKLQGRFIYSHYYVNNISGVTVKHLNNNANRDNFYIEEISGNGDTLRVKSNQFYRITKNNQIIQYFDFRNNTHSSSTLSFIYEGEAARPYGYWIERHKNGNLKTEGEYFGKKIGTWIDYHENGKIKKIINYDCFVKNRSPLPYGSYTEYYETGNLKVKGKFKIIEEYTDYFIFHSDTYEEEKKCCKWKLKSIRYGQWLWYDKDNNLTKSKNYKIGFDNLKYRIYNSRN